MSEYSRGHPMLSCLDWSDDNFCKNGQAKEEPMQKQYAWRKHFNGLAPNDVKRLKALKGENGKLKRLLAESDLEIAAGSLHETETLRQALAARELATDPRCQMPSPRRRVDQRETSVAAGSAVAI
jgi:hypothetical protein